MVEFELNKPYSTKEVAENLMVSYGTFRNNRKRYEDFLSEGYEGEIDKKKYIFTKKKKDLYRQRSEELYNEIYLPAVVEVISRNPWNTAAGITNEIGDADLMSKVQHLMNTAYRYVCDVLGNEYNITERKYAACMGKGVYPRFMSDEEIKEGNELKSKCAKDTGEKILELTEKWANRVIKTNEYNQQLQELASGSFVNALAEWVQTKGFIPVLLKHYEKKELFDGE